MGEPLYTLSYVQAKEDEAYQRGYMNGARDRERGLYRLEPLTPLLERMAWCLRAGIKLAEGSDAIIDMEDRISYDTLVLEDIFAGLLREVEEEIDSRSS